MSKSNQKNFKMSQSDSQESNSSNTSHRRSKQALLNSSNPLTGRVTVTVSDSDSDVDSQHATLVDTAVRHSNGYCLTHLSSNARTIILTATSNGILLKDSDFRQIMSYKKETKNRDRMTLAQQKMEEKMSRKKLVISKSVLKSVRFVELKPFLDMPNVHLNSIADFVAVSSEVVGLLVDIFEKSYGLTNVDYGILSGYFNARFADVRNQANCKRKPRGTTSDANAASTVENSPSSAASNKRPLSTETVQAKKKKPLPKRTYLVLLLPFLFDRLKETLGTLYLIIKPLLVLMMITI